MYYGREKDYYVKKLLEEFNHSSKVVTYAYVKSCKLEQLEEYILSVKEQRKKYADNRQKVISDNKEATEKFITTMLGMRVDEFTIFKKRKRGKGWASTYTRGEMYAHWKKVLLDVLEFVPFKQSVYEPFKKGVYTLKLEDGKLVPFELKDVTTVEIILDTITLAVKGYHKSNNEHSKLYEASIKWAIDNNEDIPEECITDKEIIDYVDTLAKEQYRLSIEGDLIEVSHGDGDRCEWEVGSHRCVCGNNRYYLEIDGDLNEYYSYGQWC